MSGLLPKNWPVATKILVALLVIAIVPLAVVFFITQNQTRDGLLQEAQRNLRNTAVRSGGEIDSYLEARLNEIRQTAATATIADFMTLLRDNRRAVDFRSSDFKVTQSILASKATAIGNNSYFYLVGLDGRIELTSVGDGSIPTDETVREVSKERYFTDAAQKGLTGVSDPILRKLGPGSTIEAVVYFSTPVRDVRNLTTGVLVARLSLQPIWEITNSDSEVAGPGSYTILVDQDGIKLADSRTALNQAATPDLLFNTVYQIPSSFDTKGNRGQLQASGRFPDNFSYGEKQEPLPAVYQRVDRAYNTNDIFFGFKTGDNPNQAAYSRLASKSWSYFVIVPESTYLAAADNIARTALIVAVVVLILVILLAFLLARTLTSPIRRITRVLGRIGMGDFEARVPVRSTDELGHLSESLNAMFDNTLTLIQTREEKEELQDQITRLLNEISTVAEGDLSVQAEVTADITGAIADSFNLMIEELRRTIINIQQATGNVSVLLEQMVQNNDRADRAADQQADRIMIVTGAVAVINESVQQVNSTTEQTNAVAQEARENARNGGLAVTKTIANMSRIRSNVQETAKKIKRLGESSQQIGEIVKLIDDIADQTNMLALNAAIQATMAGEQGKGFSVVNEEVRRLATRSANAAREIAALVKSIQDDTTDAVVAMEESTREVVEGSKVADEAGRALASIELVVDRVANLIANISTLSHNQASTSAAIAHSMTEISYLTQQATSLRHASNDAMALVARTAEDLRASVSSFKVTSDEPAALPGASDEDYELADFERQPVTFQPLRTGGLESRTRSTPPLDPMLSGAADGGSLPETMSREQQVNVELNNATSRLNRVADLAPEARLPEKVETAGATTRLDRLAHAGNKTVEVRPEDANFDLTALLEEVPYDGHTSNGARSTDKPAAPPPQALG